MKDEIEEMEKKIVCLQEELRCMRGQLESREIKIRQLERDARITNAKRTRLEGKVEAYEYCLGGRP